MGDPGSQWDFDRVRDRCVVNDGWLLRAQTHVVALCCYIMTNEYRHYFSTFSNSSSSHASRTSFGSGISPRGISSFPPKISSILRPQHLTLCGFSVRRYSWPISRIFTGSAKGLMSSSRSDTELGLSECSSVTTSGYNASQGSHVPGNRSWMTGFEVVKSKNSKCSARILSSRMVPLSVSPRFSIVRRDGVRRVVVTTSCGWLDHGAERWYVFDVRAILMCTVGTSWNLSTFQRSFCQTFITGSSGHCFGLYQLGSFSPLCVARRIVVPC